MERFGSGFDKFVMKRLISPDLVLAGHMVYYYHNGSKISKDICQLHSVAEQ